MITPHFRVLMAWDKYGANEIGLGVEGGVTCKVKLGVPAFWTSLPFNLCLLFGTYGGVGGVLSFGGGVKSDGSGRGEAGQAGGIPTRGILQQENSEPSLMHNLSWWNVISR